MDEKISKTNGEVTFLWQRFMAILNLMYCDIPPPFPPPLWYFFYYQIWAFLYLKLFFGGDMMNRKLSCMLWITSYFSSRNHWFFTSPGLILAHCTWMLLHVWRLKHTAVIPSPSLLTTVQKWSLAAMTACHLDWIFSQSRTSLQQVAQGDVWLSFGWRCYGWRCQSLSAWPVSVWDHPCCELFFFS